MLAGSRRLAILDEHRVPYDVSAEGGPWNRVGTDEGGLLWPTERIAMLPAAHYRLGALTLWCRVVPDPAIAKLLDRSWFACEPLTDAKGTHVASVWRRAGGGALLPFDPDESIANCRSERYLELGGRRGVLKLARRAYYAIRPLLPRTLQIALRRLYSRSQARAAFPRWPVESSAHDLADFVLQELSNATRMPIPRLAPWPRGYEWALVLTHDVETREGYDAIPRLCGLELAYGYRSSWNFVAERYAVEDGVVRALANAGFEIGVHGLRHDGRDLAPRTLRRRLPTIRAWAARWGAVGFRAPATHRSWELMPQLGFDYDSSYPDTDPYEPQAGGCCSWLPFFNGHLVELPITLPQDHTVFVILQRNERLWFEKADVLRARGGMALLVAHPDYLLGGPPLDGYRDFLDAYAQDVTAWKALPRDVAAWWRRRAASRLALVDGEWEISGPAVADGRVAWTTPTGLAERSVVPAGTQG